MAFEQEIRDARYISRWAIARVIRPQSNAEHHFFVAVYADQVAEHIEWGGERWQLLRYALWHDREEDVTGDMPGPAKRLMTNALTPEQTDFYKRAIADKMYERFGDWGRWAEAPNADMKAIVKVADRIDERMYQAEEAALGNVTMRAAIEKSSDRLLMEAVENLPASRDQKQSLRVEIHKALQFHFQTSKVFL